MRKISLALGLAILFAISASAQTTSSTSIDTNDHGSGEAYLGWTHVTGDVGKNGWDISVAKNLGTHFAAEAEGFGAYGDTTILTIVA